MLDNPDGLVNLRNLAREVENILPENKTVPIVLVPGFSGWGAPLFGALNYFGGVRDIPKILADAGYTVIISPVAPISSNWERACELYRQLTFGKFSTVNPTTGMVDEVHDVDVDYGTYFDANPEAAPEQTTTTGRRRAILVSNSPSFQNWTWKRNHKVHFVCHSQGGNTVRYLISLMERGAGTLHPRYFSEPGRDDWTISVTTLGTPHKGTTIINAFYNFLSQSKEQAIKLFARLFAAASFYPPDKRAYDLQLDHWGIRKKADETFDDMRKRLESDPGPVWKWLNSNKTALYDNSIEGVHDLAVKAGNPSTQVYYFTFSFHATVPFPERWPQWGRDAIASFPTKIGDFFGAILPNWMIRWVPNVGWIVVTNITQFRRFVTWVTQAILTRLLQELDYNIELPLPGKYIPRKDVIPIFLPSVYAMGGQDLTQDQINLLGPNLVGDWYQNDGIVNTASMHGPDESVTKNISTLPDFDFSKPGKRGCYWHFGVNDRMDHADEIGVFIEESTVGGGF
ncbi:lipase [Westerdykella ornata]|uniref:Lipase n=1 Tax=Westerdykella ornata TaxID=318751 RepID=A0A6A6JX07_WESOR|nr:lipase [Westerdykella ornata]KAF2280734.1 lipase [Westerdykella ornata]